MSGHDLYTGFVQYAVLLFSLVFHEFGHAWTALRCGDPTAKLAGRVTLNPAAHVDFVGTVLFPLAQIFAGVPLIGWARPVPFDPRYLRHPRRDDILIAVAGPGFNLILALAAAVVWRLNGLLADFDAGALATVHSFLRFALPLFLQINVLLALFNLIPMPPLDGSYVMLHILPRNLAERYRAFGAQWGFLVVLILVYTGVARHFIGFGYSLVWPVLRVVAGG